MRNSTEKQNVEGVSFVSEMLTIYFTFFCQNICPLMRSFWLSFVVDFYFMISISRFFSLIVQKKRRDSASVLSAFPEGPPVLDYREPEPPPKKHKYQQSLKTLIPFRFGSKWDIHQISQHIISMLHINNESDLSISLRDQRKN